MRDHRHTGPAPDPDTLDLGDLVMQVAHRLRAGRMRDLAPFDLTPSQARAFLTISRWPHDGDELRLSALAAALHVAPRSATELVDALQDKGLLDRSPSPTDRRATVITLTTAGDELRDRLRTAMDSNRRAVADDLFAALTLEQRDTLTSLLRTALKHPPQPG